MSPTHQQAVEYVVPQWVCDIIYEISQTKEITMEQATKLIILHGALYYELLKKEDNKYDA